MPNIGSEKIAGLLPNALIATRGRASEKRLYLTFDDGPHESVTDELREFLDFHNVVGNFFCIGENLRKHSEVARRLLKSGHTVCNHSDSHRNYRKLSLPIQLEDLAACQAEIQKLGADTGHVFRAPQGQLSMSSLLRMKLQHVRVVHWSYDSLDYQKASVDTQIQRFRSDPVDNGDVILFHDDSDLCIRTLETLLPEWQTQGFTFGSVLDLR